jgi:hypothetical protein
MHYAMGSRKVWMWYSDVRVLCQLFEVSDVCFRGKADIAQTSENVSTIDRLRISRSAPPRAPLIP